jgi:hypothetical protein
LLFLTHGKTEWFVSIFGAAIGGMLLPAMAIYPAELFPTAIRATADGWAVFTGRVGGVLGLLLVGLFSSEGHTGAILATTTIGLWLAMALLRFLPEPLPHAPDGSTAQSLTRHTDPTDDGRTEAVGDVIRGAN